MDSNDIEYLGSKNFPISIKPKNIWFGFHFFFTYAIIFGSLPFVAYTLLLTANGDIKKYMKQGATQFEDAVTRTPLTILSIILIILTVVVSIEVLRILIIAYSTEVKIYFDKAIFSNKFRKIELSYSELSCDIKLEYLDIYKALRRSMRITVPQLVIPNTNAKAIKKIVLYAFKDSDVEFIRKTMNSNSREFITGKNI